MLRDGRARRRAGTDTVVAYWERHGRPATVAQLGDLEVIPARTVTYRGASFAELDVQAVLDRRPELALVDELAHTNLPGERHAKRWQDVDDLLASGIDVYTTLNVANIESLGPTVSADHRRAAGRAGAGCVHAGRRDQARRPCARGAAAPAGPGPGRPRGASRYGIVELLPLRQSRRPQRAHPALARSLSSRSGHGVRHRPRHQRLRPRSSWSGWKGRPPTSGSSATRPTSPGCTMPASKGCTSGRSTTSTGYRRRG